ncbi:hypothetical protein MNBD_GAMMA17-1643 [hydrothermal vent metagenome]|uniref:Uncharacterized protein n=1 Tax=hydrothermal vent metagenome TaxID=652676 RepID=A0A3B0ZRY9_9ZZZZ
MFNKKMRVLWSALGLLLAATYSAGAMADAAEFESEIKGYQKTLEKGSFVSKKRAIGELEWLGISDERVYEPLEELILAEIMTADRKVAKQVTYYIKGLSFSGNKRYHATLKKVVDEAENRHLIKHSLKAIARLDNHILWNPVIAADLDKAAAGENDIWRVKNMLSSDMVELQRVGVKRVYREFGSDPLLLATVKELLLAGYKKSDKSRAHIDLMAWSCKVLGASGDTAFLEVLQEVADNAEHKKVKKHAIKAMRSL